MESRSITDGQITASSQWDGNHAAIQGRLNFQRIYKAGAWSARKTDPSPWLQVDIGSQYTVVMRVATQGRQAYSFYQWVKNYKLQYGNDTASFQYYKEPRKNEPKVKLINNAVTQGIN